MNILDEDFNSLNEPFDVGRPVSRLLFDLGIMFSCLKNDLKDRRVLDFGSGTGWISEWLNRMDFEVTSFDLSVKHIRISKLRMACDKRIKTDLIHFHSGDGHKMPFQSDSFGHICCFDTLHHMVDFRQVLSEFYRVLIPNGRAIFVEPGANHATSKETIEFLAKYRPIDPDWIERSIDLKEIYKISRSCGFSELIVRPVLLPELREYQFEQWQSFRQGNSSLEVDYLNLLKEFNYNSRVVFYLDKRERNKKNIEPEKDLKSYILMGKNDNTQCGPGWYELENFPPYARWTSKEASVCIKVEKEKKLFIEVLSYNTKLSKKRSKGYVKIDGVIIGFFHIKNNKWNIFQFTLPKSFRLRRLDITIGVDDVWIPSVFLA
jgi:SAM-dependent methyltransferase